ncbi:hypothetical protein [Azospirillum argentinense]|uniref:phage tail assembly chaperone n=1 Tax=Azospirillum argentinense TaxID=2970906 RepID=UPI0032E02332
MLRIRNGGSWEDIQQEVARRLAATDRYYLPDFPLDPACRPALDAYRQTLRNINRTFESPDEVVFPTLPEIKKVRNADA